MKIDCVTYDKVLVLLKKQTDWSIDKLSCKNLFELLILDLFQFFSFKDLVRMYKLKKLVVNKRIDRFHCHAIKKINQKLSSGYSQEIVILLEINKQDTSPNFRSVRFPKPQIFVEMFRRNLQSSVWKRHVGAHQMCTNMAAGK